jgi:hypothetical protein
MVLDPVSRLGLQKRMTLTNAFFTVGAVYLLPLSIVIAFGLERVRFIYLIQAIGWTTFIITATMFVITAGVGIDDDCPEEFRNAQPSNPCYSQNDRWELISVGVGTVSLILINGLLLLPRRRRV